MKNNGILYLLGALGLFMLISELFTQTRINNLQRVLLSQKDSELNRQRRININLVQENAQQRTILSAINISSLTL